MAYSIDPANGGSGYFGWYDGLGQIDHIENTQSIEWSINLAAASTIDIQLRDDFVPGDEFSLYIDGVLVSWSTSGTVGGYFQGDLDNYLLSPGTHVITANVTKLAPNFIAGDARFAFADIKVANVAPTIVNDDLTPALGACDVGAVLGSDDLQATDADGSSLNYTVDTLPAGVLLINGEIAQAGATFTQADINGGYVDLLAGPVMPSAPISTPNGPMSGAGISFSDSFNFTVRDGDGNATPGTFTAPYAAFDTVQTSAQYGGYWGGNGNDYQLGTANADNMSGGNGCDLMIGGGGADQMSGGEGNNRLFGQNGSDNLSGGNGNDLLDGGADNDQLHANGGNNWLFGGNGQDNMSAGEGRDRMWGGAGNDTINANGGNNQIDGGAGDDAITAGNGDDTIITGTGNDTVYANGGNNKFQLGGIAGAATDGNDQYTGGSGADKYALFLDDRAGNAAGWGSDTVNGFRIAEGDQLVAFNPKAGFWDNDADLNNLVASDFVTASRGTGGNAGDLTLSFGSGPSQSSVTLKWFFWDNGAFGTTNGSSAVSDAQLVNILKAAVQDGGAIASGSNFLVEGHNYISRDFML